MPNNKMINLNKSQFFRYQTVFLINFIQNKSTISLLKYYYFNLLATDFIEKRIKLLTFDF